MSHKSVASTRGKEPLYLIRVFIFTKSLIQLRRTLEKELAVREQALLNLRAVIQDTYYSGMPRGVLCCKDLDNGVYDKRFEAVVSLILM